MTETIQPEATTDSPPKRRGWDVAWFSWLKQPPEFVAAFCYLLGYLSASLWLIAIVTIIGRLLLISIGVMQPSNKDSDIKAATVLLPTLAAVAAAPFLIWRLIMMQSQTTTALEKLEIDRETQNTALYLKAVEMLGAMKEEKTTETIGDKIETKTVSKPDLEMRIGALFALERLARDSERDQPAILDMLCAYVRRNSGLDDYDGPFNKPTTNGSWPKPRHDIQTAVTVIGRRKEKWKGAGILAGKVDLNGARLMRISAEGCNFSLANLRKSNLQSALLEGTNLRDADLDGINLQAAFLFRANLEGALLPGANLKKSYLKLANLQNADFFQADLERANLQMSELQDATFFGANLKSARLQEAKLQRANFQESYLQNAYLDGANLESAQFQDADFDGARLNGARFGIDKQWLAPQIYEMFIVQAQINSAFGNGETILPPHITRPAHWTTPTKEGAEAPSPPDSKS